jgi:hypothetical protein
MLEYLYDLLDDLERQAVQDHVGACADCQSQLEKAREHRNLLGAAARMEFPNVRFVAPSAAETAGPAILSMTAPQVRVRRPWRRWAAAAAILATLGGLAGGGAWERQNYTDAGRVVAKEQTLENDARLRMKDAVAEMQTLSVSQRKQTEDLHRDSRSDQLQVAVVGPAAVPAGEPAVYEIKTADLDNRPVAAEVTARALSADHKQVADLPVEKGKDGENQVTVPSDLLKAPNRYTLVVSARVNETGAAAEVEESFDAAAPVYVTHLDTDKSIYEPAEVVHFRSLTLDRSSLKPAEENLRLTYELITPKGARLSLLQGVAGLRDESGAETLGFDGKPIRGVGAGEYVLPPNCDGGEYTLICREENDRFAEQERSFLVQNDLEQKLRKRIEFSRPSYGPGDEASARCSAALPNGDPLRKQPVEATVWIDGKMYGADGKETQQPLRAQTDDNGTAVIRFRLPDVMERGDASLNVTFAGVPETISRPAPVVLKKLNVAFYPEGGDLAAGQLNRVYFQVRTLLGKPADLKGRLLEDGQPLLWAGRPVVVETVNDDQDPGAAQGRGRFELTPAAGKTYELAVDSPAGIAERFPLPPATAEREDSAAVALHIADAVTGPGQPIRVSVSSARDRNRTAALYCRGRLLQTVRIAKGEKEAVLHPDARAAGVLRVTIFEQTTGRAGLRERPEVAELTPVAERLIYRRPAEQLSIHLQADRSSYVPTQRATVQLETKNEKDEVAPAVVMFAAVDTRGLARADAKTHFSMPTDFLLSSEISRPEDLEYADFLLGPHEKAAESLDLLLGVQGWRRFVERDAAPLREKELELGAEDRLLAMTGQSAPAGANRGEEATKKLRQESETRAAVLKNQYDEASASLVEAKTDPAFTAAVARQAAWDVFLEQLRGIGAPLLGVLLAVAALVFLALALCSKGRRAISWYAAAAASVVLIIAAAQAYRPGAAKAPTDAGAQIAWVNEMTFGEEPTSAPQPGNPQGPDAEKKSQGAALGGGPRIAAAMPFGSPNATAPVPPPPASAGFANGGFAGGLPADKPNMKTAPAPSDGVVTKADADLVANGAYRGQQPHEARNRLTFGAYDDAEQTLQKRNDGLALTDNPKQEDPKDSKSKEESEKAARRALWDRNMRTYNRTPSTPGAGGGNTGAPAESAPKMLLRQFASDHGDAAKALPFSFAETVCWRPVLVLPNGRAEVSFDLSEAATTFQITAFAHTLDGRLGAAVQTLESRSPRRP